jgi:hypothetical protein
MSNDREIKDMEYVAKHPKETYEAIRAYEYREGKKYDNKSIKNLLTAILSYYKGEDGVIPCDMQPYHKQYLQFFREAKGQVVAFYDQNQPTEKQKEGVLKWEDVLAKRDELGKKEYGSRRHLLLSMYTYMPPLRQDFDLVKILAKTPKNGEGNYLILNSKVSRLVLNEYKTSYLYGKQDENLPKELTKVVKASLQQQPREYLFTDVDGNPYKSANSFTSFSNRTLKEVFNNQAMTVTMLRHAYISSQDYNKLTEGEKKELARQMGHSVEQQGVYRHIVKDDEVVEEKQEAKDDTVVQSTESIQPVDNDTTKKQDISKIIEEMNKQHQEEMKMLMEQMQKKHEERINAIVAQFG